MYRSETHKIRGDFTRSMTTETLAKSWFVATALALLCVSTFARANDAALVVASETMLEPFVEIGDYVGSFVSPQRASLSLPIGTVP